MPRHIMECDCYSIIRNGVSPPLDKKVDIGPFIPKGDPKHAGVIRSNFSM